MNKSLLFIMTLSGTEVFILYILFYPFAHKYFSIRWRYLILKISMVFYLVPFAWFKFIILKKLYELFPALKAYFVSESEHIDLTKYILVIQQQKVISWQIKLIWLILCFIGTISAVLIYHQLHGYLKLKKSCLNQTDNSINKTEIFQNAKTALGVRRKVRLIYLELCGVPCTIGIFHPCIILPLSFRAFKDIDYQYIIEHELNHIKNSDTFFKYMALLAVALNWYNPFCHFMYRELCNVSELYCDFCTAKGYDLEQRTKYGNLIIDIATEGKPTTVKKYVASLVNNDKKVIERRLLELKKYGSSKKSFLSGFIGIIICVAGSITSFAYNPPVNYNAATVMEENPEIIFHHSTLQLQITPLPYEHFWTDANGNIIEIKNTDSKAYCPHNYESGTFTKHFKYDNNSCKVVYLNGKRCSLCGITIEGSTINTIRYDICPH